METPNVSTALRRTRRNVIAMGKLVGVAVFGIAMSPRSGEAAGSGGKPCFLKGTRIRVGGGEKRIEEHPYRRPRFHQVGDRKTGAMGGASTLSQGAGVALG